VEDLRGIIAWLGSEDGAERVVCSPPRATGRQLNADWHAIYVETPTLQRLPRFALNDSGDSDLAQNLGATTAGHCQPEIRGECGSATHAKYNLSKLVSASTRRVAYGRWHPFAAAQKLALLAPDLDLIEIGQAAPQPLETRACVGSRQRGAPAGPDASTPRAKSPALCVGAVRLRPRDALSRPLALRFDRSNIVAVYLLAWCRRRALGRGPAASRSSGRQRIRFFFGPPCFRSL